MGNSVIKLLPEHIANQIAAGEVVQRPASVVKELMENALDASATEIKVLIKDGGKSLIQVIDNGSGMNETDARMSLERHATSKISKADDLFAIQTKGFRGEALASIVAVSHTEIKTKTAEQELGTFLRVEGSKIVKQEPVAVPKGTSIAVKNLFFNIPARRKFLKSVQVEMKHIHDEFVRLALAHTQIKFTLIHNDNVIYQLPESGILQRISNIFGSKIKEKLVPVKEETDYVKIHGFTGKPEFAKLKRGEQFFFVNNRFIKSPYLNHAILTAYEGLIKEKSYPSYFIFFEIDPKHIDVNIHPTKTEIKFDDESTVYSILKVAVKHSLGQFNLSPSMDFEHKPDLDVPYEMHKKTPKTPSIEVNPNFNPFENDFDNAKDFSISHFKKESKQWDDFFSKTHEMASDLEQENKTIPFVFDASQNFDAFQWMNKFIVTTFQGNLLIIHQQRAHELVLYKQFLKNANEGHILQQKLIFPIELELQAYEMDLLKTYENELIAMGFELEFSEEQILVTAIPSTDIKLNIPDFFEKILKLFSMEIEPSKELIKEEIAKTLAKTSAIKTGQKLEKNSIDNLLKDLFKLESFMFSPNNKRIFVQMNENEFLNQLNR